MDRSTAGRPPALIAAVALCACAGTVGNADLDVAARSAISGTVNGSPFSGTVSATLNTGMGGSSSCEFTQLPMGFSPATFGTFT
jgi:hypothetical protein